MDLNLKPKMELTDEKLVHDYLSGDEQSLELLISKYLKPLYNFVYQLVQDQTAAEDIVQDTFFKAWKNLNSFDPKQKFSTWLYTIAKNTAYDWLKKKKTLAFSAFENEEGESWLENIQDENALYSQELLAKMDNIKDLQELLAGVSPQLRTVLLLHHKQGFSLVEIAQIMKTPTNTIKSQYRRTLLNLRQKLFNKKANLSLKSPVEVDRKSI